MKRNPYRLNVISWVLSAFWLCFAGTQISSALPVPDDLDRYVAQPDDAWRWEIRQSSEMDGCRVFVLRMASQRWGETGRINRTLWWHWMKVVLPPERKTDAAFLYIEGGNNSDQAMPQADEAWTDKAREIGGVFARVWQIPNQPLLFSGESEPVKEDDLLARSWNVALEESDPDWIAHFAMVKAAVRAMDTVQALNAQQGAEAIHRFVLTGGSKRGWTAWLTAVADRRVCAVAPAVIDMLNMEPSMRHHYAAYGFWSPAITPYVEQGFVEKLDEPGINPVFLRVDPWTYRHRLSLPKYIVNASGDQFFLSDSSRFYWDGLPGEKHLRYHANADHGLRDTTALDDIVLFYAMIAHDLKRPEYRWEFEKDGTILLECKTQPLYVRLWQAGNPDSRDFRMARIGKAWKSSPVKPETPGRYRARVSAPEKGWTAAFLEFAFPTKWEDSPFRATSGIRVLPETLPYEDRPLGANLGKP